MSIIQILKHKNIKTGGYCKPIRKRSPSRDNSRSRVATPKEMAQLLHHISGYLALKRIQGRNKEDQAMRMNEEHQTYYNPQSVPQSVSNQQRPTQNPTAHKLGDYHNLDGK